VIVAEHEGPYRVALSLALGPAFGTDHGRDFGRNHVAVRVYWDEKTAPFQGESDAAPGRGGAHRAAQPQGFSLEIQELLGIYFASDAFDRVQELALERSELGHLARKSFGIAQDLPRRLEAQRERRGRGSTQVVRRDAGCDVGVSLPKHRANAARIFTLPGLHLQKASDGQKQLHAGALSACEHDAARDERLDGSRQTFRRKNAATFRDAEQKLSCRSR
jgi:hypothetical protein